MANDLKNVLMQRDGMTERKAVEEIRDMRARVYDEGEDPEEILEEIGLEPDYVFDLLY